MREIRDTLISETVTEVDVSTIWKFLQTSNITGQKMVLVAKQISDFLRAEYHGSRHANIQWPPGNADIYPTRMRKG